MSLTALLIVHDDSVRDFLTHVVQWTFSDLEMTSVQTADDAMSAMRQMRYDIVICDAGVARCKDTKDRISFIHGLCGENRDTSLVVITADTELTQARLHAPKRGVSVQAVLYKPILLQDLTRTLLAVVDDILKRPRT